MIELLAAMLISCGGPGPDPYPGTTGPVHCVDYTHDYTLPAVNVATGKEVPGLYFACHHEAYSHADTCVLKHKKTAKRVILTRRFR